MPVEGEVIDVLSRAPRDRQRVTSYDPRDLRAWCDEFEIPMHQVRSATFQAGVMIVDERAQLARRGWFRSTKD
jgi:hypothetical protein